MKVRMKLLSGIVATVMVGMLATKAEAINDYIPDLYIYEQNGHPCVNINIDMTTDDVYSRCNISSLNLDPWETGHNGQQSIQTIDNQKVVQVNRNNPSGGNKYIRASGARDSSWSLCKSGTIYSLPNHGWVSMSYKVKGSGSVDSYLEGSYFNYGKPFKDLDGNYVTFAETVNFNNNINEFRVNGNFHDGDGIQLCMNKTGNVSYAYGYYTYNASRGTFIKNSGSTVTSGTKGIFNAGEKVLAVWNSDVHFIRKDIPNDGQWHTVSSNVYMDVDEADYSYSIKGGRPAVSTSTQDKLQIKDMRFGKASKVQVAREDGTIVYDDYGSEFTDTGISSTPMKPEVTNATTLENSVHFNFNAKNSSKTVNYKARSLGSSGNSQSQWSRLFPVTLASEIKGYSVVVDTNPQTEPVTVVNNTSGEISIDDRYKRDDVIYCHVKAVDQNGNWSETMHYKYTVKQTLKDYKADIKQLEDDSDKVARSYSYKERLGIKDKITKTANDLRTNPNLNDYKPEVVINNKDNSNAETEFSSGEKLVNIYVKKS